jgi:hypothetical protein
MNARLGSVVAALALAASAVVTGAGTAVAANICPSNHFCAYSGTGFTGDVLANFAARSAGTNHMSVPSNKIKSIQNNTGQCWLGRDDRSWPLPDHTVETSTPHSAESSLHNPNQIDWFDVRDSRCAE